MDGNIDRPLVTLRPEYLQGSVDDDDDGDSHRAVYRRRRPMHPGRFMAFVKSHFGPLDVRAAAANSGGKAKGFSLPCKKRNRQPAAGGDAVLLAANNVQVAPLLAVTQRPRFGSCSVSMAGGCVWFVGGDDCQGEWEFKAGSHSAERSCNHLRRGAPWLMEEITEGVQEAGGRRVELAFTFCHGAGVRDEDDIEVPIEDDAMIVAEARLTEKLDACLLSRSEAAALDIGNDHLVDGVQEWEVMCSPSTSATWSPVLGTFETMAAVVSAIPGQQSVARFGGAITRRVSKMLGGVPDGPGHEDI